MHVLWLHLILNIIDGFVMLGYVISTVKMNKCFSTCWNFGLHCKIIDAFVPLSSWGVDSTHSFLFFQNYTKYQFLSLLLLRDMIIY